MAHGGATVWYETTDSSGPHGGTLVHGGSLVGGISIAAREILDSYRCGGSAGMGKGKPAGLLLQMDTSPQQATHPGGAASRSLAAALLTRRSRRAIRGHRGTATEHESGGTTDPATTEAGRCHTDASAGVT